MLFIERRWAARNRRMRARKCGGVIRRLCLWDWSASRCVMMMMMMMMKRRTRRRTRRRSTSTRRGTRGWSKQTTEKSRLKRVLQQQQRRIVPRRRRRRRRHRPPPPRLPPSLRFWHPRFTPPCRVRFACAPRFCCTDPREWVNGRRRRKQPRLSAPHSAGVLVCHPHAQGLVLALTRPVLSLNSWHRTNAWLYNLRARVIQVQVKCCFNWKRRIENEICIETST